MDQKTEERIRARAHAIWVAHGRPDHRDVEHWLQAVRELTAEDAGSVPEAKCDDEGRKDKPVKGQGEIVAPTPPQGR